MARGDDPVALAIELAERLHGVSQLEVEQASDALSICCQVAQALLAVSHACLDAQPSGHVVEDWCLVALAHTLAA